MNALNALAPSAACFVRSDHASVLAKFHDYRLNASPSKKKAIVESISTAVEIHGRLEEEILYPALRVVEPQAVERGTPEHDEMRRQITRLRGLDPATDEFDAAFFALMRVIIHHVAEEETVLLPAAERSLSQRMGELGAQMMRRRLELAGPKAGRIAANAARAHPGMLAGLAALVAVGGVLAYRQLTPQSRRWMDARWLQSLPGRAQRPMKQLIGRVRHAYG